jgi:hypothetical protein
MDMRILEQTGGKIIVGIGAPGDVENVDSYEASDIDEKAKWSFVFHDLAAEAYRQKFTGNKDFGTTYNRLKKCAKEYGNYICCAKEIINDLEKLSNRGAEISGKVKRNVEDVE